MKKIQLILVGILLFVFIYYSNNEKPYEKINNSVIAKKIDYKTKINQLKFENKKNIENVFGFIKMDTIAPPKIITELINEKIKITIKTDFTGNNKTDYIVLTENDDIGNYKSYWINSNFEIVKKESYYPDGQYSFRLVNIDNDKAPEIFNIEHYEDGTEYYFSDDVINNDNKTLFYFTPIYQQNNKNFYAYPDQIEDIILRKTNKIELKVAINHNIIRDGNITFPDNQKVLPLVFFKGKPVDNTEWHFQEKGKMKIEWLNLDEIIKRIKK